MGWIFGGDTDAKVAQLDKDLKDSFARVRQDTGALYQWIQYLQQQLAQQQQLVEMQQHDLDDYEQELTRHKQLIERLQSEMHSIPKDPETIKRIIDAYYDFDDILERVRKTEDTLTHLERTKAVPVRQEAALPFVEGPADRRSALPHVAPPSRLPALRDKIVQRITRNSKEYLKGIIMNMITRYSKISALQLREIVVEEQGLASKSSFYRFLEELEDEGAVTVISDGKEKVLMVGGVKKPASR